MADLMQFFTVVVIVQLFFSVGITMIVYTLPTGSAQEQVEGYGDIAGSVDIATVGQGFENSVNKLTNTPIVDIGILVFYSGNVLLDLLINFAFATPAMISLVFNGLMNLFAWDTTLINYLQIFLSAVMMIVYFIGLLQLITNIRTGRVV